MASVSTAATDMPCSDAAYVSNVEGHCAACLEFRHAGDMDLISSSAHRPNVTAARSLAAASSSAAVRAASASTSA